MTTLFESLSAMSAHRTRFFAAFVSLSAVLATPLAAQSSLQGYGPVSARYRMVITGQSSQIMMGETQVFDSRSDQVATVVIAKVGSVLTQVMTLDSVAMSSTSPVPTPDVSSAIGMKLTGTMDLDGKVATSAVTDKMGTTSTSQFATNMRSFLPRLKIGATSGTSWVDSATSITKQNGADVTTKTVTTYTVAGDTTVAGARAWKIASMSTGKVTGSGNQQGADFTIGGSVTSHGTFVISLAGVFLGADLVSDVNMIVEVPMASMTIPTTQKQTTKISKLP